MANLIQVKRSTTNAVPAALNAGELAYSFLNTSNSLFIGNTSTGGPIRIAGGNYAWLYQANTGAPGALTANAVVITDGNSFVTNWKTNGLTVGVNGEATNISNISTFANTTQLGAGSGGANTELATTWAIKTYVDGKVANATSLQTNTYISFGVGNLANGGSAAFTFDSTSNTLAIGNSSVNTTVNSSSISTGSVNAASLNISGGVSEGNTTVTGFVNASSYGTFGGAVNAASFNTSGLLAAGNTTVTGFVNVSSYGTFGGTVNAAALNVSGVVSEGNTTVTGFVNASSYGTFGGTVNAASFNSTGTGTSTFANNVTVTGVVNATSINTGDLSVSGNLTVTGTLTTISANNLSITDALIYLAANNTATDVLDIGFTGAYGPDGNTANHRHTGLYRDHTDGVYKLFTNLLAEPGLTVDSSNSTYTIATLKAHLSAGGTTGTGFIANATTIAVTANSTLNVAIVANTLSLSTALSGTSGGTGLNSFASQDLLVANASNGFSKLSVGSEGYIMQVSSGVVAWNTLDGGSF